MTMLLEASKIFYPLQGLWLLYNDSFQDSNLESQTDSMQDNFSIQRRITRIIELKGMHNII